ncbi:MAG: hypothetical protein CMB73_02630 [Euryarchaeota archaeon]|nr:hypothetical protein [Euryarchaeota archaeon]|tara:strand:+ start:90 stop:341 length:252 start_codon:yes stop_codon:yes gene_type:complete
MSDEQEERLADLLDCRQRVDLIRMQNEFAKEQVDTALQKIPNNFMLDVYFHADRTRLLLEKTEGELLTLRRQLDVLIAHSTAT